MGNNSKKFLSCMLVGIGICFGAFGNAVNAEVLESGGVKVNVGEGSDSWCFDEVFKNRGYDFYSKDKFMIIDIGMNVGYTSLFMANKENVTDIYAFEPFKATFDLAIKNIALNPNLASKIKAFDFGISNKNKEVAMHYDPNCTWGMSTMCDFATSGETEKLTVKRASEVLAPIMDLHKDKKIYLKMDCECEEYNILPELDEAGLLKKIDVIVMEWHWTHPKNLMEILEKNNFVFFANPDLHQGIIKAVKSQ